MKLNYLILIAGLVFSGCQNTQSEKRIQRKAEKIHKKVFTVDTHTDTPLRLGREHFDVGKRNDPYENGSKVDFPRMKEGGLDAVFFAVFIGQGERTPEAIRKARVTTDEIFSVLKDAVERNSEQAELAYTPEDGYRIERTGKRAVYIGLENGYPIGTDLEMVEEYYRRGARYITLCHSSNNDICDSSTDPEGPEHHGLSLFGEEVVKEMNRLGMMIDVSHISDEAFYDVLKITRTPVIASHSCTRALCASPRNLDDDMLKALATNGGVVQICFVPSYVADMESNPQRDSARVALREKYRNFSELDEETMEKVRQEWYALDRKYPPVLPTVSDMVDHIDHVVEVAGIDHVGIGTDFDGGGGLKGCFGVSAMSNITTELVKRGYSEEEIRKIWGGNFMRVFREVAAAAGS